MRWMVLILLMLALPGSAAAVEPLAAPAAGPRHQPRPDAKTENLFFGLDASAPTPGWPGLLPGQTDGEADRVSAVPEDAVQPHSYSWGTPHVDIAFIRDWQYVTSTFYAVSAEYAWYWIDTRGATPRRGTRDAEGSKDRRAAGWRTGVRWFGEWGDVNGKDARRMGAVVRAGLLAIMMEGTEHPKDSTGGGLYFGLELGYAQSKDISPTFGHQAGVRFGGSGTIDSGLLGIGLGFSFALEMYGPRVLDELTFEFRVIQMVAIGFRHQQTVDYRQDAIYIRTVF